MKHRLFLYAGLLAALLGMGGCGGGGGGDSGGGGPVSSLALFAGDMGGPGNADGVGAAVRIDLPLGVATDSAGNVYVAGARDHTIRKITPAGVVSTFAGKAGEIGSADAPAGPGTAARFSSPAGVAIDSADNVYVADSSNHTIRKITPVGAVTTFAGASASFLSPVGIATDSADNVYVADSTNHTIRKITPAGLVSTLAGMAGQSGSTNGTGPAARFNGPRGVATDSAGNVYVADTGNHTIRKITPAGVVSTFAGAAGTAGQADGTVAAARFSFPTGVATGISGNPLGEPNVYVADSGNHTIRRISPDFIFPATVITFAGTALTSGSTDATGAAARFNGPGGVATDGAGNIYVADTGNGTIRKITPAAEVITLAGMAGATDVNAGSTDATGSAARFNGPTGVATDGAGNVYVADTSNSTIRRITPAAEVITLAGTAGLPGSIDATGAAARFRSPTGIATDNISGNVYVADSVSHTIRKITPAAEVITFAGTAGLPGSTDGTGTAARFSFTYPFQPSGVATDSAGNIYVADTNNHTIRRISPAGIVITFAGAAGVTGDADGGAAARFFLPQGVATDSLGNVYVADTFNSTIRKIAPTGTVVTLAGTAGLTGGTDATGSAARFNQPAGVATDSAGNVYVADTGNHTIRKITPAGVVSTVVGVAGQSGFAPGALPGLLAFPQGVAVSGRSLYITLYNGVAVVHNVP